MLAPSAVGLERVAVPAEPRSALAQLATARRRADLGSVDLAFASATSWHGTNDQAAVHPGAAQKTRLNRLQTGAVPAFPSGEPNPALDPQGNLWDPDGQNSRFQTFAPDGTFLEVGVSGSERQFDFVETGSPARWVSIKEHQVTAQPGTTRPASRSRPRSGCSSRPGGSKGSGNGQFQTPLSLAVDGQGRVFVADNLVGGGQVFDADGRLLATWGGPKAGEGN